MRSYFILHNYFNITFPFLHLFLFGKAVGPSATIIIQITQGNKKKKFYSHLIFTFPQITFLVCHCRSVLRPYPTCSVMRQSPSDNFFINFCLVASVWFGEGAVSPNYHNEAHNNNTNGNKKNNIVSIF